MGGFSMNKVLGTIKKRQTFIGSSAEEAPAVDPANDTPEDVAARSVKQFCQSVGSSSGDDVVFLPAIVEAAVASPAAAAECARLIRKYMNRDYWTKPSFQYNAIMLARILADNPGPGFTKFIDKKFADTAKELLRSGRDASVRQILMETLDAFETTKSNDENLVLITQMWKKEKEKAYKAYGRVPVPAGSRTLTAPPFNAYQVPPPNFQSRPHHSKRLPDPVELANRLEEARTSAKLLEQVVACTPPSEVLANDLIKEFADRCASASRSIQAYMNAENPGPDDDTMESLIDTNEQLQNALNQHHRAVLQARKHANLLAADSDGDARSHTSSPHHDPPIRIGGQSQSQSLQSRPAPALPVRRALVSGSSSESSSIGNGKGKAHLDVYDRAALASSSAAPAPAAAVAGPSRSATDTPHRRDSTDDDDDSQDPFRDPPPPPPKAGASSSKPLDGGPPRLSYEPFHPGFGGGGGSTIADRGTKGEKGREKEPVTPVSDDDDDDGYGATPKAKGEGGWGGAARY